jgi:hypothetical protein
MVADASPCPVVHERERLRMEYCPSPSTVKPRESRNGRGQYGAEHRCPPRLSTAHASDRGYGSGYRGTQIPPTLVNPHWHAPFGAVPGASGTQIPPTFWKQSRH